MTAGRMIRVRADKPSTKERTVERLEAIAEQRGASLNSLILEAIRQYVSREEGKAPTQEDLTRVLRSATSLLGTITDTLSVAKQRLDRHEAIINSIHGRLFVLESQSDVVASIVQELWFAAHPEWTQEQKESAHRRISKLDSVPASARIDWTGGA